MSDTLRILFRDSSTADGVQSRGAGWHARKGKGGELGTGELAEGDLIKVSGKPGGLYICDGQSLSPVDPPGLRRGDHRSDVSLKLAQRSSGDRHAFWETTENATDLLWLAWMADLERRLLALCACDCAETVLHLVPSGTPQPRRALRAARRWAAGAATPEEIQRAGVSVFSPAATAAYYASSAALAPSFAANAAYYAVACFEVTSPSNADDVYAHAPAARSLAFLVRTRIPSWRVGLALARKRSA